MRILLLSMCMCVAQIQCVPFCAPPGDGTNDPDMGGDSGTDGEGSGQPVPGSGINFDGEPAGNPIPDVGEPVTVQVISENNDMSATVSIEFLVLDVQVHQADLTVGPLELADPVGPDIAALIRIEGQFETGDPLQSAVLILGEDFEADDIVEYIIPDLPIGGDACPDDPTKVSPGVCGCGVPETDTDGDGTPDCVDLCVEDPAKTEPGACGCGELDTDSDGDGTADCRDECPNDANKDVEGSCGCGDADIDTDGDGVLDCFDGCPEDSAKTAPGLCGCGQPENCDQEEITDCNNNEIDDEIEIAEGLADDCNCNGIPDECDIANLTSKDCNEDGIPDECVNCPTLELVVVVDTSGSLSDEAQALCNAIPAVINALNFAGIDANATFLGTTSKGPGPLFPCVTDTVANLLGTDVPGDLGVTLNGVEDWGLAAAIVADRYPWDEGSTRLLMTVSDEGPIDGNPCLDPGMDRDVIELLIDQSVENDIVGIPVVGGGADGCVQTLASDWATGTAGIKLDGGTQIGEIDDLIHQFFTSVCADDSFCPEVPPTGPNYEDCNGNGLADTCEIPYEGQYFDEIPGCGENCAEDCNFNGVPDECDIDSGESQDVEPENGIPDECEIYER